MICLFVLDSFIDDDTSLDIELGNLARNIKKEVCKLIDSFFSFFTRYDEKRIHNMLALM
jgi:hypothetical protein